MTAKTEITPAARAAKRREIADALVGQLVAMGAPARRTGPTEVASTFSGQARGARVALLDGRAGLVWSRGATLRVAFEFTVIADTISAIEMIADPEVLAEIDVAVVARR